MSEYVVSCNPRSFDIVRYFSDKAQVVWKQAKTCRIGDAIYIYVGRPYSRIMYRCIVQETNLLMPGKNEYYLTHSVGRNKNRPYMTIELQCQMPDYGLSLEELTANGLKTVQCTTQVSKELGEYIEKIVNNARDNNGN